MALEHDIPIAGGIIASGAYVRIFKIEVERRGGGVMASVYLNVYKDRETRDSNPDGGVGGGLTYEAHNEIILDALEAPNTLGALYDWLKTQPEFAGATDV